MPRCSIVGDTLGESLFISAQMDQELVTTNAQGYRTIPIEIDYSDEFKLLKAYKSAAPSLLYLVITGRCNGKWGRYLAHGVCATCEKPFTKPSYSLEIARQIRLGNLADIPTTFVDANSWNGEDFFLIPQSPNVIITERIAEILLRTGNLRKEMPNSVEFVKKHIPKLVEDYESVGWNIPTCSVLGPADWSQ
jgi:hypothetical protein